jgi:geranylgeranyl diphosphate synthase type I
LSQLALLQLSDQNVPAPAIVAASRLLNQTCATITCGQYLDIGFENRTDVTLADYLGMIEEKTAALVACACEMGALIATSGPSASSDPGIRREHLRAFGYHLGMAFQMCDDVLGIWGDTATTGKPVGSDIARRKKSLPILHGLERSPQLRALLAGESSLSEGDVYRATELLQGTDSREYTEQLAGEHHAEALAALEEANLQGAAARALHELAQVLINRER